MKLKVVEGLLLIVGVPSLIKRYVEEEKEKGR